MSDFVRPVWASPRSVSSVLITGPTEEPITLDQAKLAAGLDWPAGDPRDAQMQAFISAARQLVEQRTGLALLTQTRDVTIAAWADVLPLPAQALPVQTITDPAGVTYDRAALLVDMRNRALTLPCPYYGVEGTWRIVAGWRTPAELATEAPLLVHAVSLLTAHLATLGRDAVSTSNETFTTLPLGFEDALAPFVQVWVI